MPVGLVPAAVLSGSRSQYPGCLSPAYQVVCHTAGVVTCEQHPLQARYQPWPLLNHNLWLEVLPWQPWSPHWLGKLSSWDTGTASESTLCQRHTGHVYLICQVYGTSPSHPGLELLSSLSFRLMCFQCAHIHRWCFPYTSCKCRAVHSLHCIDIQCFWFISKVYWWFWW